MLIFALHLQNGGLKPEQGRAYSTTGKGRASRGQISDLQSIADNLATNLTQEIEEDARAGRVDTQKIKAAEVIRSVHG